MIGHVSDIDISLNMYSFKSNFGSSRTANPSFSHRMTRHVYAFVIIPLVNSIINK